MGMQVPGLDPARAIQPLGQVAGFAPGGGAHVQQLHARPGFDGQGGKHAALALDAEAARLEVRVPGDVRRAVNDIGCLLYTSKGSLPNFCLARWM